ncbi:hypothetical protein PVAND_015206 [Polypedilum vanderplanki]|uniref:F-box domain-containing protein n=1 Tax=Polypedilum vanderplanki TaxID=319348 RepID=A0A9J6BC33_POLVA|nr:hypothetical protein PVAND_015206 [Polypedilum vanderplanki]
MDLLPKEIFLEIFKYLSSSDLIALTEVCSTFNQLISSTERLLDKIPVYLQYSQSRIDLARSQYSEISNLIINGIRFGRRKYTKIFIGEIDKEILIKISEILGENVHEVVFKRGNHELETVAKILLNFKNVRKLKFCRRSVRSEILQLKSEIPILNIDELLLENIGSQVFRVLAASKVKKLECTIGRRICQHEFIPEEVGQFLTLQNDLKELKLERIAWNINDMLENENINQMKFKLTSLSLNDVIIDDSNIFTNFMRPHFDSLKKLELVRIEEFNFSQVLRQMTALKELKVISTWLDIFRPFDNVVKLEIEYPHVLKFFPNLKELKISCAIFGPYQIHLWNEYIAHPQLTSIEIGNLSMLNFPHLPTLRKLKLKNIERIYVEVFYQNPQIEELVIEKREGRIMRYDYEIDFISSRLPNLKLLEIVGGKVCRRYLDLAKERCKKLKYLRLIDVDVVAS